LLVVVVVVEGLPVVVVVAGLLVVVVVVLVELEEEVLGALVVLWARPSLAISGSSSGAKVAERSEAAWAEARATVSA